MQKREAKFQTVFNKYLRELQKRGEGYGHYELKQTQTKSFAFSKIQDHQIAGLMAAEMNGFVWKYSDQDQRMKPFDCSSMPRMKSYIVIKYPECFCIIGIHHLKEWQTRYPEAKGIHLTDAQLIAERILTV